MPLVITASPSNQDKHLSEIYALLIHNDKLYSAAVDGKIKVWHPNLELEAEFQAHESAIYHIAAHKDTLYSCSNDGTLQAWSLDGLKHKKTLFQSSDEEILRLYVIDGTLYSGNDKGILSVWKNDKLQCLFSMVEEIRDFSVADNLMYTVRDRDVCINELMPEEPAASIFNLEGTIKFLHSIPNFFQYITVLKPIFYYASKGDRGHYIMRKTLEGRSPLCIVGNKLCFATRSGNNICVHENSQASSFKELGQIQAHEMILNALCGFEDSTLFSGGYDGKVKQWNLETLECINTCEVGFCINTICIGSQGQVYVAGDNGFINRLDNK
ncbi:F-box/WD repeat-containing protein pof11 isoform X1 [Cryptotermes secundus]|uniref:F-box/WD repeat-containing protein pof11 isoform X1 n=1 Tax=Cryptotermes secundus TaxID=105785 RepID=UPI000CD7D320|nr:F-box/WD repeat-containing protein pof11 isoform X1 [Cryptotermes secundus]